MTRAKTRAQASAHRATGGASDGALALRLFDLTFRGPTWQAWRVWLLAVFGLSMTDHDARTYTACTARQAPPTRPAREAWVVAGRRSGKSRMAAFLAAFLAAVRHYPQLAAGERGIVMVVAPGRRQAAVILDYTEAFLSVLPGVTIARRTAEEIELSTGLTVAVQTASFRTPRGFTCVGAIVDEIAFLRSDDAANPDQEIIRALRPSLASVHGSLLLAISSPYAQRGMLYETHERQYGKDTDVLVWQAPTRTMNPTIPQGLIDNALAEDPAAANAEWNAEFRSDLESLFTRAALGAVVVPGRFELAPQTGTAYVALIDASGGSGADSMTMAIAHRDPAGRPVLDAVRERKPPFSPEDVVRDFAADLRRYGVQAVWSDLYGGQWVVESFAKAGVTVEPSPLSRSEIYLEAVPLVNAGTCQLLDSPRLLAQLAALERRTGRSGRDSVDHRPGSHDDLANAAAGALVMSVQRVGLRASLPADFTVCINMEATAATVCALLSNGPHFPSDGHCRTYCVGLQAVLPVYRQHRQNAQETNQPMLTAAAFLSERFDMEGNRLTHRSAIRRAVQRFESIW